MQPRPPSLSALLPAAAHGPGGTTGASAQGRAPVRHEHGVDDRLLLGDEVVRRAGRQAARRHDVRPGQLHLPAPCAPARFSACAADRRPGSDRPGRVRPGGAVAGGGALGGLPHAPLGLLDQNECTQTLPSCQPSACRREKAMQVLLSKQAPGSAASSAALPAGAPPLVAAARRGLRAHRKFQSTVWLPQEATIQRSWRPASVTHVNLPCRMGAPPTLAASSGRRRSRRGRGAAAPMRLLKPLVSRLFLSCRARRHAPSQPCDDPAHLSR